MRSAYVLRRDVNWQRPVVQQAWQDYGPIIGRFLSVDVPSTATELTDLAYAYVMQQPQTWLEPVCFSYVLHCLLELSEVGIVQPIRIDHLLTRRNIDE